MATFLAFLSSLPAAVTAYFTWRTKVDQTPAQREVQQDRAERDEAIAQNDEWIAAEQRKEQEKK